MKKTFSILIVALLAVTTIISCKKETNSPEENDNELITTIEVHVTESGTSNTQVFKWEDVDGPGGENPVIEGIVLAPNKTYAVEMQLFDKTKTPIENSTDEIREENQDHRFYFEPSAGSGITVSNPDLDDSGIPLGINSSWSTASAATGTMHITLRHYPNGGKAADDLVSSSKSSTDAEADFNVTVQ